MKTSLKQHLPTGHVNLTVTVPEWLDKEAKAAAKKSGMSRNKYILAIIQEGIQHGFPIREQKFVYPQKSEGGDKG